MEYSAARVAAGGEFMLTLRLRGDAPNPLFGIPEAGEFRQQDPGRGGWSGTAADPHRTRAVRRLIAYRRRVARRGCRALPRCIHGSA